MSFDLYFASVGNINADNLFNELGCNRLFSWLEKSSLKRWLKISNNPKSKLFIDSGAYTSHSQGKEIDIDEYDNFLIDNKDSFTVAAQLDKIPGVLNQVKTREQILEAPQISWENYLYMRKNLKDRLEINKLVPVFHQGEDFKWLKNMLEYEDDLGKIEYIGISPANDLTANAKIPFIEKSFDIINKSSSPDIKTHAFGMTSLDILEKFPFTSADSTSWKLCSAFGSIMTEFGTVTISDQQTKQPNHINHMPSDARNKIINRIESYNLSYDNVIKEFNDRTLYNIHFLYDWAENYQYKPMTARRKSLF